MPERVRPAQKSLSGSQSVCARPVAPESPPSFLGRGCRAWRSVSSAAGSATENDLEPPPDHRPEDTARLARNQRNLVAAPRTLLFNECEIQHGPHRWRPDLSPDAPRPPPGSLHGRGGSSPVRGCAASGTGRWARVAARGSGRHVLTFFLSSERCRPPCPLRLS